MGIIINEEKDDWYWYSDWDGDYDRDWGEIGISTYQDGTEVRTNVRTYIGISIGN